MLAEVNQATLLGLQLPDQNTAQFCRARVRDSANSNVSGSPFTLSQVANGLYTSNSWTPTVEGIYSIVYEVYSDAGFTSISSVYGWLEDNIAVRSIDQDLATLIGRLTSGRATNLDNLDATVSSRNSTAHFDAIIGTPAGASVSADILSIKTDTTTLTGRLTSGRATNLDNLDATISSRALAATAVSNVDYTALRATKLDNLDVAVSTRLASASYTAPDNATISTINTKIGVPVVTVSADIVSVKTDTSGLRTDYTTVRAAKLDNLDVAISTRSDLSALDVENAVWDATQASHVTVGTTGKSLSDATASSNPLVIAAAVWDELASGHMITGSFGSYLDAPISSRCTESTDFLITIEE